MAHHFARAGWCTAIVEPVADASTASLRARFEQAGAIFAFQGVVRSVDELEAGFRDGSVRQAIVLPAKFGERLGVVAMRVFRCPAVSSQMRQEVGNPWVHGCSGCFERAHRPRVNRFGSRGQR